MQQPDIGPDKLSPLMTLDEVCRFFGGSAPLHPATIYRGIGVRYPQPVKIGPNSNRWLRTECVAALQALADRRMAVKSRDRAEVLVSGKARQKPVQKATGRQRFPLTTRGLAK
jgi:predicted DNA-binding transcriptional regulator AlpA